MDTVLRFVGIDVSKRRLDVFVQGHGAAFFTNDSVGIQQCIDWLGEGPAKVGLEATGNYHELVAETLLEKGFAVHVYNPRNIRDLAKGLGILAKTDRVDAKALSRCLSIVEAPLRRRSATGKELRDVSRHIQYLTRECSSFKKKRYQTGLSPLVMDSINRQIQMFELEIQTLEKQWIALLAASEVHAVRYRHLLTVPRIGCKSARAIVSELPEDLSTYSRKGLAAYFGLAPYDNQSGDRVRRSRLLHGNAHMRQPLFMAATLALRLDPVCLELRNRLNAKGKHYLTIVCAVMHKLARRAIAVLLDNRPWEETTPVLT